MWIVAKALPASSLPATDFAFAKAPQVVYRHCRQVGRLDDPIRNAHSQMAERNLMLLKENGLSAQMRKSPEPCSTVTFLDYGMAAGGGFATNLTPSPALVIPFTFELAAA